MRLWDIDLIPYLPRTQILAQWRELNSIFKKQDKHILINYIYNYGKYELRNYARIVMHEMRCKGYKINEDNYFNYFASLGVDFKNDYTPRYKEHNTEYLLICFMNLYEKYLRGQKDFDTETFNKLYNFVNTKINLTQLGITKGGNKKWNIEI